MNDGLEVGHRGRIGEYDFAKGGAVNLANACDLGAKPIHDNSKRRGARSIQAVYKPVRVDDPNPKLGQDSRDRRFA
jgi:hypothetical protein